MINLTDQLIIKTKNSKLLSEGIRQALFYVYQLLEERNGKYTGQPVKGHQYFGFQRFFPVSNIVDKELYDEDYLKNMFEVVSATTQERSRGHFAPIILAEKERTLPLTYFGSISTALSIALVHLWSNDHVLLPTAFNSNVKNEFTTMMRDMHTDALSYFDDLLSDAYIRPEGFPEIPDPLAFQINHLMKRIFYATDWHTFERLSLSELVSFRDANIKAKNNSYEYDFKVAGYPVIFLMEELVRLAPEGLMFTDVELQNELVRIKNTWKSNFDSGSIKNIKSDRKTIIALSKSTTHDDIFEYITSNSSSRNFKKFNEWYPGRGSKEIDDVFKLWAKEVKSYMDYWTDTYEAYDNKIKTFYKWFDYILLYLPWWKELYPDNNVKAYLSPSDVVRSIYIKRTSDISIEEMPLTFVEYLNIVLPSDKSVSTKAGVIRSMYQFYKWYKEEHEGDTSYIPDNFVLPFRQTDVTYRGLGRQISAKVKIPKRIYSILVEYVEVVEFALSLYQEKAINGELDVGRIVNADLDFKDVFCPVMYHHDVMYRVDDIPLMVQNYSHIKLKDGTGFKLLPSLSTLRMILFMLHTGLRMAAITWLDRTNFDMYDSSDLQNFRLYVNTDKAREQGYKTLVNPVAWSMLNKEKSLLEQLDLKELDTPHYYKGRESSRFGEIFPVFCSSTKLGECITDSTQRKLWLRILTSFQAWYKEQFNDDLSLVTCEPIFTENGEQKINKKGEPVTKQVALHSLHAIRKTVISERATIMPTSTNALLVGHSNDSSNIYYQELDEIDVDKMLCLATGTIKSGFERLSFDRNDPAYIKPARSDSALRTTFAKSRANAAEKFGFTSISLMQTDFDSDNNENKLLTGLDLIEDEAVTNIVFHDECICPVGDECPEYILEEIFEPRRCGLCRLAIKTVDNIPAINARKMHLEKSARLNRSKGMRMRKQQAEEIDIAKYYDKANLDSLEAIAWHLAETTLYSKLESLKEGQVAIHVDDPEMVKLYIKRHVEKDAPGSVRLLKEIADSNAYVDLQSDDVRNKSSRLMRLIFKEEEGSIFEMDEDNPIQSLCSRISSEINMKKMSVTQVVEGLEYHRKTMQQKSLGNKKTESDLLTAEVLATVGEE